MSKKYNLFANTGMQFIYTGLFSSEHGLNWQNLAGDKLWVKCRTTRDVGEVVLCVDTNTGSSFHVAESEQAIPSTPIHISLEALGVDEDVELAIIPEGRATGQPKDVALVLDFGNCRSVGLLVEGVRGGGGTHMLPARPFELPSHHLLWRNPTSKEQHTQQVFESGFVFVSDTIPPVDVKVLRKVPPEYGKPEDSKEQGGLMAKMFKKKDTGPVLLKAGYEFYESVRTELFRDISPVRMGAEVDFHLTQSCYEREGRPEAGLSSPKRYLWDQDKLDGSYWHQFVPAKDAMGKVEGSYFKHQPEDDRDWEMVPENEHSALATPAYPRRSMIVASVLELLNRAYQQINSEEYRLNTPDPNRKRLLKHLVMSFPSGLTSDELGRYRIQVEKAVKIFCHTHKLEGQERTQLRMAIDEGTAGQLAFIYGETLAFDSADSWLKIVGRPREGGKQSVRIATIDIGGGTSDMVISDFKDRAGGSAVTGLVCEIRLVDGANRAGDDLLEAVLQKIIIPQLANQVRLSRDATRLLFEGVSDRTLVNKKSGFLRDIWKPLANRYISMANGKDGATFKLNEIGLVKSQRALDDFEEVIKRMSGGSIIVGGLGEKEISFNRDEFQRVVMELFRPVLTNFCDTICRFDCDIVTLAGRPSNLHVIQEFVRAMLPLPEKRIVPMGGYRTGSWYPLPDPYRPGVIEDPKSVVVVGCAIEHLCKAYGALGSLQVTVENKNRQYSYYWGEVSKNKTTFRNSETLFKPGDSSGAGSEKTIEIIGRETFIARRLSSWEGSQPVPSYAVRYARGCEPHGQLFATLRCQRGDEESGESESLELAGVEGCVILDDGLVVDAVEGQHIEIVPRGMVEAQHFLDGGVLLGIDYNKISEN